MPVSFRELDDPAGPERVAFLRIIPERGGRRLRGALLITNGIGEPVELTYARLESPLSVLCSDRHVSAHAARILTIALFDSCRAIPDVLLFLESETPAELFEHRIRLEIPTVAVCGSESGTVTWRWVSAAAYEGGASAAADGAAATIERIAALDLLSEPFGRAERALAIVLESEAGGR